MADGSFPGLVSRNRDANAVSNEIYVGISDGTEQLLINASGEAEVVTNFEYAEDTAHTTGDVGNFILAVRNDAGTALADTTGDYIPLSTDASGNLRTTASLTIGKVDDSAFSIGTDEVIVNGFLADETTPDSVDEGDVGAARMTLDRKQLEVLVDADSDGTRLNIADEDAAAGAGHGGIASMVVRDDALTTLTPADGDFTFLRVDSTGRLWVVDDDLDANNDNVAISDGTDTLAVNSDGSINVNIVTAAPTGEIHNYDTTAAVAADATDNHDYTATGGIFLWKSVIWSGSGNVKAEMQNNAVTFAVGFLQGRQGDTKQLFFDPPVEVAATQVARVIRTNRQGAATDVYSTIIGTQL